MDLRNNELTGRIPPELGNLANLEVLRLDGSSNRGVPRLEGPIPPELGNLVNLRRLDLSLNQLTGLIPPELGNLARLERLSLERNRLTGPIPPELGNLANLTRLSLITNGLTGPIPPGLGNLSRLERLQLKQNGLTGPIPSELGSLARLVVLDLGANHLTNPIPPELGNLTDAELLLLEDNDLSGSVPHSFSGLTSLRWLYLGNNAGLGGPLPAGLTALGLLDELVAGGTDLCAPSDLGFATWLEGVRKRRVARCDDGNPPAAYLTQAVQSREFPVPLVAGEKALLRVFVTAARATDEGIPRVLARFYVDGRETHVTDIPGKPGPIPTDVAESDLSKSANTEIPGHVVQPGLEMVLEVDPDRTLDPGLGVTRRIPEEGKLAVEVRAVPTFRLTIVPFLWRTAPDSAVLTITRAMAADPEEPRAPSTNAHNPAGGRFGCPVARARAVVEQPGPPPTPRDSGDSGHGRRDGALDGHDDRRGCGHRPEGRRDQPGDLQADRRSGEHREGHRPLLWTPHEHSTPAPWLPRPHRHPCH